MPLPLPPRPRKRFARVRSWISAIVHRSALEREMDEELRFHIDACAGDLMREGLPRDEAMRRAYAEFGSIEARKEECRDARGLRLAGEVRADVRYTLRQLRRAPLFTAVAILSLALGIGANSAIFSLMEQAVWKAMPVKEPERLRLFIWASGSHNLMGSEWGSWSRPWIGKDSVTSNSFSYAAYQAFQQRATVFEQVFAFKPIDRVTAIIDGQAEVIHGQLVSGNFYDALGVVPIAGRAIDPTDDTLGRGEIAAVISEGFWARRFGRDPAIVGRVISVNQVPVTIVGVNPPGFHGVDSGARPDIFMPVTAQPRVLPRQFGSGQTLFDNPDYWWLGVMGRLAPNVTDAQALAATDAILQQEANALRAAFPDRKDRDQPKLELLSGSRGMDNLRESFAQPLILLFAFVALVLLLACANVANLLLARAETRRRELSLRLALGAGRARIARQLLTEGLTLGIGGGALGVLIGYWLRDVIPNLLMPSWTGHRINAAFDARVLLLSAAVTIATSLLFSLAPIWQSRGVDLTTAMKDAGRAAGHGSAPLRGRALIVFQVGLSVLLLIAAGLFVRTLANLRSVDLGFTPNRILLFAIDPPRARYAGTARPALFDRIREQIAAIPGVEEASFSFDALVAGGRSRTGVMPEGETRNRETSSWVNDVGYRFTETMGIPIVSGRSFDTRDRADSPPVAIVNRRWVREFYASDPNPVGRTFRNGTTTYRIIGICGDTPFERTRNAVPPTFYRLIAQARDAGGMTFEVRTSATPAVMMPSIRDVVDRIDRDLPLFDVRTQQQQIDATVSRERLFAALTTAFGVLALVLASIGIYGLLAHNVTRRTGEIGIRIALGARRLDVLLMVLREASWLASIGVGLGIAAAIWLGRYVEAMLFNVKAVDPTTIAGAIALMMLVALLAGWLPARRASRLDPMVALRHD